MNKLARLVMAGLLLGVLTAFVSIPLAQQRLLRPADHEPTGSSGSLPTVDGTNPAPTGFSLPTATRSPSQTPTLAPDAWQTLPVVPGVGDTVRRIYQHGRLLNNNPHAFSILGDCLSLPDSMLGSFGKSPRRYNLGTHTDLQSVIDWFVESFDRNNMTLVSGFTVAAELSTLRADPAICRADENPMACEYRTHFPSFAIISLGTDDLRTPPKSFEKVMRTIIEYTIAQGIVPILATKADNREGHNEFNRIIARLAYEYDVPLWNFWAAVQSLPRHGLADDRGHLRRASPSRFDYPYSMQFAMPVRALTALQVLDAVWRGVNTP